MNFKKIFTIAAGVFLLTACVKESQNPDAGEIEVIAEAILPGGSQTKVTLTEGADAYGDLLINVDWNESGESFTVMTSSSTASNTFTQVDGPAFKGTLKSGWSAPYYAFYPATSATNATSIPFDLSSQNGTLTSNNPYMYAKSTDGRIYKFNHLTALIKMTLNMPDNYTGTPSSITLTSNSLVSKGTVNITESSPAFSSAGSTISLPAQKAAQGTYTVYVYVNPMAGEKTFNLTLTDASTEFYGTLTTSVNIKAGEVYTASVEMKGKAVEKLAAPSDLFLEQIDETHVIFSWKDNADKETGYRIYKSEPKKNVLNTADLAADKTEYQTSVVAGNVYNLGIQARGSVEEAHSDRINFGDYKALSWEELQSYNVDIHPITGVNIGSLTDVWRECGAPQNITFTQTSNTSGTVTWTCWSGAETGFHVYVRKASESNWTKDHVKAVEEVDATSTTLTGLTAGETYIIGVQTQGTTMARNSNIIELAPITLEAAKSNVTISFTGDPITNFNFFGLSYKVEGSTAQYPAHGICWSADDVPTVNDMKQQGPTFATSGTRTAFQILPNILFEDGKKYKLRAYVHDHLVDTYCYSDVVELTLPGEPGIIGITATAVSASSISSAIKLYSFTAKNGAGNTIKGHYAVADCSSSSPVQFKVLNPSSTSLIGTQANNATGCQVLINGTIFGNHNIGVVVQNGSQTQEYIEELGVYWGEVKKDYQNITRAIFGVNASGTPSTYWVSRPSANETYYYNRPIPAMAGTDAYPAASTVFPDVNQIWNPYHALSCGPMLVYDGRVMVSSSYSDTYSSYYNNYELWGWSSNNIYASTRARTAVGYLADGKIVLLVIDETGGSAGAKLPDVARIMQGLGCVSAMNLDGGGSSAMWVKGKNVVNNWSSTSRSVKATCGFFLR